MAPIDQAYTKMLNDIVLLIVGGIGGIVGKRAVSTATNALKPTPPTTPTTQQVQQYVPAPVTVQPQSTGMPNFNWMGYVNPDLDESWTPGPPPTTPPEHMEPDEDREEIAKARKETD